MSFRARNREGAQAVYYNRLAKREDGWGVLDRERGSCIVVSNSGVIGDGERTLNVQAGEALLDGERLSIEQQPVDIPIAENEPRKDVIGITTNGAVLRVGGDQAPKDPPSRQLVYSERPAPPDLHEDPIVPLAIVAVPADATTISNSEVRDIRPSASYVVGEINGTDPDEFTATNSSETITGSWTFNGGLQATDAPENEYDVLRQIDSEGFADSARVDEIETDVNNFTARDQTITGQWTFSERLRANRAPASPTDVLRQEEAEGFADVERLDDLDSRVSNLTAADIGALEAVSIHDDGVDLGEATTLDLGTGLGASVSSGTATITAEDDSSGGGGGAGAVVRAVDHGADPTGTDSSSAALQAAVDAAGPGDTVVWGESGTYYLDAEIVVTDSITLDLGAGTIESDYHDETPYPDEQDQHYLPLFRIRGSLGMSTTLTNGEGRGDDQVVVDDATLFSVGDGVIIRSHDTNRTTLPLESYSATVTAVREIDADTNTLYLEDELIDDYSAGEYATVADYLHRPTIKNVTVRPRTEPAYDDTAGKVLGGPRHIVATEICDQPRVENVDVSGYDTHLWTGRDDRRARVIDCTASNPMNLSGSSGEPFAVHGSTYTNIVRPTIRECRRGVDARSGAGTITVDEPEIVGVSLVGVSWHSTTDVAATIVVRGGRVEARPDDPTMDNKDGSLDRRREMQSGRPFNTSVEGHFRSEGVTYVGRTDAIVNGSAEISGGEIYKHRDIGTVLTVDGEDVQVDGTTISSMGAVANMVDTTANTNNVRFNDVTFDCSGGPSRAMNIDSGSNISVHGQATSGATGAVVDVSDGTNIDIDMDVVAEGEYAYLVDVAEDVSISGRIEGACSNEVIRLSSGSNIDIDCDITASGSSTVRGVRLLTPSDVQITGSYEGPASGVLISDAASGVVVRDMRVNVTSADPTAAIRVAGSITDVSGCKFLNNDLRGTVTDIQADSAVTGFWAVNNTTSGVSYPDGTTVGAVSGNLLY